MFTLSPVKSILAKPGTAALWPVKEKALKANTQPSKCSGLLFKVVQVIITKLVLLCSHVCSRIFVTISVSLWAPPFSSVSGAHQPKIWHFYRENSRSEYLSTVFRLRERGSRKQPSSGWAVCYNGKMQSLIPVTAGWFIWIQNSILAWHFETATSCCFLF